MVKEVVHAVFVGMSGAITICIQTIGSADWIRYDGAEDRVSLLVKDYVFTMDVNNK